jgi:hypothetical protein
LKIKIMIMLSTEFTLAYKMELFSKGFVGVLQHLDLGSVHVVVPGAPNGVIEYIVTHAIQTAAKSGVKGLTFGAGATS